MNCYLCRSPMRQGITTVCAVRGVKAYICDACGEVVIDAKEAQRIEPLLRQTETAHIVSGC